MAKQDVELKFSLIDGVSRNLEAIQQGVTGLGASIVKLNASADLTGKAFGAISAAGDFLAGQITSVGNFEDSLASLQAVTGASAAELEQLKNAAIAASQASIFSSTQAADGLTELARAGFTATEAISTLTPVLALAQGQQLSVAESSQFLTTTLTQFSLASTDAGRVADVLASTADKAQLNVRELGQSLSYAAPIANQLGLTLEETTAIIGKLADEGFRGERGGTALANVFTALIDPSSKFSKELDKAGIKTRDFNEVMEALRQKGEGAQKILLALDTTARPAITALATKGSAGIRELTATLNDSAGAAQRTADILGNTFNSTVQKFQNNMENLRNAVLQPILAPLGDEIDQLSQRLIAFSQSPEFGTLVDNFTKVATAGIQAFGEFIASVDFTEALVNLVDFSTSVASNLATIANAFRITGDIIGGFGDIVSITLSSIKGVTSSVAAALIEPLAVFDEGAKGVWLSLRAEAEISEKSVGTSLAALGSRFTGVRTETDILNRSLRQAGEESSAAAAQYTKLAKSLVPEPLVAVARAAAAAVEELKELAAVPEPARLSLGNLARSSDIANLSLAKLQQRARDVRNALENATPGSQDFLRFANDSKILEEQIRKTKASIDEATGSNEKLAKSANTAAGSLRNQASAARDAAAAGDELARSNSQVDESFGNIANQSSETAISLGNMTAAFTQEAIAATNSARSGREYAEIWNSFVARYQDQERQIQNRIDALRRMSAAENEQAQIQARYASQYGNSSVALQELIELEQQYAASQQNRPGGKSEVIPDTASNQPPPQTPRPTASAPDTASAGRGPIQITINQNGANADTIREIAPLIQREFSRLGFLSR